MTNEYSGDSTQLLYLRARQYSPTVGRFLTKDPSRLENNLYRYSRANPVNFTDPTGLFSKEILMKNGFGMADIKSMPDDWTHHRHWGFYMMLRNAQSGDSIRVGEANIMNPGSGDHIFWSAPQNIYLINCDQIIVGGNYLAQYYENEVASRSMPLMWWRDTSAMYYELSTTSQQRWNGVDGADDNRIDYPQFTGISLGLAAIEIASLTDSYGNHYFAVSGGLGAALGLGYVEGYFCGWRSHCSEPPESEIQQAITGICLGGEAVVVPTLDRDIVTGVSLSAFCHAYNNADLDASSVTTFYLGYEAALGVGGTLTVPSGEPPSPGQGWRWAITDRMNGLTYRKVLAWEIQQLGY